MLYFRRWISEENKNSHKQAHDAAIALLQNGLLKEYGIGILPEICCGSHGKPAFKDLPDIRFNYSHCKKAILCGISDNEIGVDVESLDRPIRESLIAHACCEAETVYVDEQDDRSRAFLRLWVAKEAYLKYLGTGIGTELKAVDMSEIARDGAGIYQECRLCIAETPECVFAVCTSNNNNCEKMFAEIVNI